MLKRLFLTLSIATLLAGTFARTCTAQEHSATAVKAAEHGTTHATSEGEKEGLMPDMSQAHNWVSALWVIIIFCIMLAILYPTAWKNVLAGLKAREQRIRNDIAEAEEARAKAETTLREYTAQLAAAEQRVREMIAAATADGERMATQIRARGEQEAQEVKERATKEIEAASKQAIAEVYEQAVGLATGIAEKILRRSLSAEDQRDLIARSLDQVQNIKNN